MLRVRANEKLTNTNCSSFFFFILGHTTTIDKNRATILLFHSWGQVYHSSLSIWCLTNTVLDHGIELGIFLSMGVRICCPRAKYCDWCRARDENLATEFNWHTASAVHQYIPWKCPGVVVDGDKHLHSFCVQQLRPTDTTRTRSLPQQQKEKQERIAYLASSSECLCFESIRGVKNALTETKRRFFFMLIEIVIKKCIFLRFANILSFAFCTSFHLNNN